MSRKPFEDIVPESSPVAGANSRINLLLCLMPDERREIRLKRPASHTALDGSIVIAR